MQNRTLSRLIGLPLLATTSFAGACLAAADDQKWQFELTPYLWATRLNGDVKVGRLPAAHVDMSFADILSDLDFGFMTAFEARKGKWGFLFDGIYTKTSGSASADTGGGPSVGAALALRQTLLSGALAYRLPADSVALDVLAGLRYNHIDADVTLRSDTEALSTGASTEWIDPFVGLRLRIPLDRGWTLTGHGDAGGFNVGSDLSWQASIGLRYVISRQITAEFGYRVMNSDYATGGFLYDMRNDGLYAGVGIGF